MTAFKPGHHIPGKSGMSHFHPIEPIPMGIANGRYGASPVDARGERERQGSADSDRSRDRYRTAGVDPLQTSMASPADSRADQERSFASDFGHGGGPAHVKFVEQRLCLFEIGRVETFGEPTIDRCEEVAGFGAAALVAAEPGEARGG